MAQDADVNDGAPQKRVCWKHALLSDPAAGALGTPAAAFGAGSSRCFEIAGADNCALDSKWRRKTREKFRVACGAVQKAAEVWHSTMGVI